MFKRDFYTFQELKEGSGASDEAIRQTLIRGDLRAYIEPRQRKARLRFLSGVGGVAPNSGRDPYRTWEFIASPHGRATDSYYLLSGWFQLTPESLAQIARNSLCLEAPRVFPPLECDGWLEEGDVFEFSTEEFGEDGERIGEEHSYLPTVSGLWFDSETIEELTMTLGDKSTLSRARSDNERIAAALNDAIVSTAGKIAADNRRETEAPSRPAPQIPPPKIRSDREQTLLRVIAGLWALSGLPDKPTPTADKISALFDSWGWEKPDKGTIAERVLAEAMRLDRIRK